MGIPVFSESKNEKYTANLEIQFIVISNYKNREVALIKNHIQAIFAECLPDNFLLNQKYKCFGEGHELIYFDLKSKVPLHRKSFNEIIIEKKDKSFSMFDFFDLFHIKTQSQSIHTYNYPPGYLD